MILISYLIGCADRLQFFDTLRARTDVHVNVAIIFQNEAIAFVHVRKRQADLTHANVTFTLHLEQTLFAAIVDGDMLEAGSHTALNVSNTVSVVAQESR